MNIIVVRGAGDLATAVIHRLSRCGFKVIALEVEKPLAIRRKVAFSEAIYEGEVNVEGVSCRYCENIEQALETIENNKVALMKDPKCEILKDIKPMVLIDAILAKKNLGTNKSMGKLTVALGPGFEAGKDVDIIIETMRGHNLGKIITEGKAKENTGIPGSINGYSKERVTYSPCEGIINSKYDIGDLVKKDDIVCEISKPNGDKVGVKSPLSGVLRGIIRNDQYVKGGLKILDIDPREEEIKNCYTISDKARNISGSVLEAIISNNIFPK